MPCTDALLKKAPSLKPGETVETALAALKKNKVDVAPVVDPETGAVRGLFSIRSVMRELLPVSLDTSGFDMPGFSTTIGAAPGMALRLQKLMPQPVTAAMSYKFSVAGVDMPLWQVAQLILGEGQSVIVVDGEGRFLGTVTQDTVLAALAENKE